MTQAHHGNLYNGATLKPTLEQITWLTGQRPKAAVVDHGYRSKEQHPADVKDISLAKTKRAAS